MALQVLQREVDPAQNQVVSALEKANEAIDRRKQLELYGLQIKQSIKNAEDEKEKMKLKRKEMFNETFLKFLERTTPDVAWQVTSAMHSDEAPDWANGFGKFQSLFDQVGKTGKEKLAEAAAGAQDALRAEILRGKGGDIPPQVVNGAMQGAAIANETAALPEQSVTQQPVPQSVPALPTRAGVNAGQQSSGLRLEKVTQHPTGMLGATYYSPGAEYDKTYIGDMSKAQAQADVGIARDTTQLGQTAQSLKNLIELHRDLSKKGVAGDAFSGFLGQNIGVAPFMTDKKTQNKLGQFLSARNETMIKMQPQLSQQFGSAGSVRIMDSLLQLAGQELPSLGTPTAMAEGQVKGTLRTMYIIKKAGDAYAEQLRSMGQSIPQDPEEYVAGVAPLIGSIKATLSPKEEQELQALQESTLGGSTADKSRADVLSPLPTPAEAAEAKAKGFKRWSSTKGWYK